MDLVEKEKEKEKKEWIISALLLLGNILSRKARNINLYYMN